MLRNLDGGIYPKFMLRSFGAAVPKGSIYAINPLLDLLLTPLFVSRLAAVPHFAVIRVGLSIAALSPLVLTLVGPSLTAVILFVLVLTVGDALYNPRTDAYAMLVAPIGREGTFAGAAAALVFLAEVPAGVVGGARSRIRLKRSAACIAQPFIRSNRHLLKPTNRSSCPPALHVCISPLPSPLLLPPSPSSSPSLPNLLPRNDRHPS